jgi:hypothetical protein
VGLILWAWDIIDLIGNLVDLIGSLLDLFLCFDK